MVEPFQNQPGNQSSQPNAPGTTAPVKKKSSRLVQIVAGIVALVIGGIAILNFANRDALPGCDSSRAKDTLSNIHKERDVQATRYREIREISRNDDEVLCHASLDLKDGKGLSYDFKMFKEGDEMRLIITSAKDEP